MGLLYDDNFYDDKSLTLEFPLNHARIGYRSMLTDAVSVTASSAATGYPVDAVSSPFTYEKWRPSSLPAEIVIDMGAPTTADYLGILHRLSGCMVEVHATDFINSAGTSWNFVEQVTFDKDGTAMLLFPETTARYWRIRITGGALQASLLLQFFQDDYFTGDPNGNVGAPAEIVTLFLGRVLTMMRPFYSGHTPVTLAAETETVPNRVEGGQWVGRSIVRKGNRTGYAWNNLTARWVRDNIEPFIEYAKTGPFFIAWNLEKFASEVGYLWVNEDISPTNTGTVDYMSLTFTGEGTVNV